MSRPEESRREYRESFIDPHPQLSPNGLSHLRHGAYKSAAGPPQASYYRSTCYTCGNMVEQDDSQKIKKRGDANRHSPPPPAVIDSRDFPLHRLNGEERGPAPTLDDVDVEALILAYKPMLHPSVRDGLEEQYSVIEASRRERPTRPGSGHNPMSRSQSSSSSTPSRSNIDLHLPSAYSSPLQGSYVAQSSTGSPSRSVLKRSKASSSSSHSKTSFLSGVITPEKDQDSYFQDVFSPDMRRTHSQTSSSHRMTRNDSSSSTSTSISTNQYAGGTAFLSGSIGRAQTSSRAATATKPRTPLSSPPVSTIPSRFTRATSAEASPGVQYSSQEASRLFAPSLGKKTYSSGNTHETISPRSSLSSRSGASSLRWSSESSKTASTSRSVSQPDAIPEILEIKNRPSKPAPSSDEGGTGSANPSKYAEYSWLSLEEDGDRSSMETRPPVERKNSLWRESLDSIASSHLQALEDKEDIRAAHFPTPPPMSRSNSLATTASTGTDGPGSTETLNTADATRDSVSFHDQSYFDMRPSGPSLSPLEAPNMMRKTSLSELLRVHIVSPLSRSRSKSSSQVKAIKEEYSGTLNDSRSESLNSSSSSTIGRPSLPPQTILLK